MRSFLLYTFVLIYHIHLGTLYDLRINFNSRLCKTPFIRYMDIRTVTDILLLNTFFRCLAFFTLSWFINFIRQVQLIAPGFIWNSSSVSKDSDNNKVIADKENRKKFKPFTEIISDDSYNSSIEAIVYIKPYTSP